MKIPKSFILKGNKWKVVLRAGLKHEDGDECLGLANPDTRVIYLEKSLGAEQLLLTFWHEYGHAMLSEIGVVDTTNGVPSLAQEIICDAIAEMMTKDKVVTFKRRRK